MNRRSSAIGIVVAALLVTATTGRAQRDSGGLSETDRAQIQQLSVRYLETLSACAASDYAALFTPDGYFESGFRKRIQGTAQLIELVKSERHCTGAGSRPNTPVPAGEIRATPQGASGRILLPNNGGVYEDVYVKSAAGWRFQSRSYWTTEELAKRHN